MSFFSDVILTTDLPEEDLKAGDVGTVVERHIVPGQEDGYSVEFFDMTGETVAVVTVQAGLKLIKKQAPSRIEDGPGILSHTGPRVPIARMHGGVAMKKAARRARR